MARKKKAPPVTYWSGRADAADYGIDASRGAAIVAARAQKKREEQENYDYWRQTSGLSSSGPIGNSATGAIVPGLVLDGTKIVASGQQANIAPDFKPSTTGQAAVGAAASSKQGTATVVTPGKIPSRQPGVRGAAGALTNMTAADQAKAQEAIDTAKQQQEEQGFLGTVFEGTTHWLSDLFNVEDTFGGKDPVTGAEIAGVGGDLSVAGIPMGGVETIWDGAFKALGWGYDRLNQVGSYGQSVLPGGIDSMSWDQANDVSWGQAAVTDSAQRTNQIGGIATPINMLTGGLIGGMFGTYAAQTDAAPFAAEGFDITDPTQRKAAFEESTAGKWMTGLTDTAISIIADPTILAGKALKITKLRYLDRLIKSEDDIIRVGTELSEGAAVLERNATTVGDAGVDALRIEDLTKAQVDGLALAPIANFAHAVVRKGKHLGKEMSAEEIFNHPVIASAANRDALTAALHNADTYEEASLVLRHAAGDLTAQKGLDAMRPDLLKTVIDGERDMMNVLLRANPSMIAKESDKWGQRADTIINMLKRMDETDLADAEKISIRQSFKEVMDFWDNAQKGEISKVGVGPTASAEEVQLLSRSVDKQLERNELFIRSLEKANGEISETYGVFQGATKGFSSDTALGRIAEQGLTVGQRKIIKGRQARATQKTIAQTRQGENSKWRMWTTDEFYQQGTGNVVARVLHWAGSERASGMISTAGVGAQESSREVMALLNGIRIFSGEGKVLANGRVVGGIQRKQELISQYQKAMLKGDVSGQMDVRKTLDSLEEGLAEELALYHGIDPEFMKSMHYWQNGELKKISDEIAEKGYWFDGASKNYAPYLETQLQTMSFMKNWRKIDEMAALASKKNSFARGADGALSFTKENFLMLNNLVQDVWRPSVLIRAGYTQRNVAEGLFRSMAFQWSLAPLVNVVKQGGKSTANVSERAARKVTGEARRTVDAAEAGMTLDQMPKRFRKWHENNVAAIEREMTTNAREVTEGRLNILRESPQYRAMRLEQVGVKAGQVQNQIRLLRKTDPGSPQIDRLRAQLDDGAGGGLYGEMKSIKEMTGGDLEVTSKVRDLINTFDYLDDYVQPMLVANREGLDDMISATASYRKQTLQRRRVYNGRQESLDPQTFESVMKGKALEDPFDPDSPYANIALANLSADHTMRQAVGMRANAVAQSMFISQLRHYAPINPDSADYMPALTRTLNQWSQSVIGKKIIDGRAKGLTDQDIIEEVVGTLFDGQTGRELRDFLNEADYLHFKPAPYVGVKARQAEALARADEAVKGLDDEIALLDAGLKSAGGRRMQAIKKFNADVAKNPRRVNLEFVGLDGKVHKLRGKEGLDEYLGKERLRLADMKAKRAKVHAKESEFEVDPHRINVAEPEDAAQYASMMLERYDQLTAGSVPLQRWLAGGNITMQGSNPKVAAESVEMFLKATDADGNAIYQLSPVLGDEVMKVGTQRAIDMYRSGVQKTFRVIGAVPEDMMVRAPFYGQRYRQTAERAYNLIVKQRGDDTITMNEVNAIRELAHRRALKDTKDWLYTIDRRTAFGAAMENWVPFTSAMQNSITTVGRIIWNDPAVLGAMRLIWQSPDNLTDVDADGNPDTFAIPIGWLPEGFKSALGNDDFLRFNKKNFDLIGQGFLDPSATPLLAITSSELMKHGFGGALDAQPDWLPGDTGKAIWEAWKDFNFGEGFGASQSFASWDMILAPWQKQLVDAWIRGDGSSAAYARTFDSIRRAENLKALSGYREDFPTYDEIESKAKGMHTLRALVAFTAFTTPKYTSDVEVLVNAVKKNDQAIREWDATPEDQRVGERPMPTEELYGDAAEYVAASGTRSNTSGMPASIGALKITENHQGLIRDIAPALNEAGDLSLLGALAPDAEAHFAFDDPTMNDPTVTAYEMATSIPGAAGEQYRALVDLAEEQYSVNVEMGWKQYIRGKAAIESAMNQAGVWNWNSSSARPYATMKDDLINSIATDKRFEGWYDVFNRHSGGTRTTSAITMFEKAAADQSYREDMKDDPVWAPGGPLDQYLANRRAVVQEMDRLGIGTLQSRKGGSYRGDVTGLAETWAKSQHEIRLAYPAFASFQDRFIGDDLDPNGLGAYMQQTTMAAPSEAPAYPTDETISPPASAQTAAPTEWSY